MNEQVADADRSTVIAAIATAVAPEEGLQPVQASLLGELASSLMGVSADFDRFESVSPEELADVLADHESMTRHRIVHLMVLGELILRPIPLDVAVRVGRYAKALDVDDKFVRIAHRYAQGGFGLAWRDLHSSGFAEHWEQARMDQLKSAVRLENQLALGVEDAALAECWQAFEHLPPGSLGRSVWEMYHGRGFTLPGLEGGAAAYLAQHDFVHVLADYGTNLNGELEAFALIGRADPNPKGLAWLTTLIGLFETGYVADAGFFSGNLKERRLDSREAHIRLADALSRGAVLCERLGTDLLEVNYHEFVERPVVEVRSELGFPDKSQRAVAAGSWGVFDVQGMSEMQQQYAAALARAAEGREEEAQ